MEKMGEIKKKWRPVCVRSQEGEEKKEKWKKETGKMGSLGVCWKWVDPIKNERKKWERRKFWAGSRPCGSKGREQKKKKKED